MICIIANMLRVGRCRCALIQPVPVLVSCSEMKLLSFPLMCEWETFHEQNVFKMQKR